MQVKKKKRKNQVTCNKHKNVGIKPKIPQGSNRFQADGKDANSHCSNSKPTQRMIDILQK